MQPAKRINTEMRALEQRFERATRDERIDRTEKRALVEHSKTIEKHAQAMVPHQGKPVVALMDKIQRLAHEGKLTVRSDALVNELVHERARTWERAKHDASTNPFEHLRHFKSPFPGMRTRDFNWHGSRVHVIAVDLNNPNVRLQTTSSAERGKHVGTFARNHHAEAAINGDFFSLATHKPSGFNMHKGDHWGGQADGFEDAIAFNGQHAQILPSMGSVPSWAKNVVSARHAVVIDGHAFSERELLQREPAPTEREKVLANTPRTGVGLSKDGRVLYMFAIDHAPEAKLGRLMKEHRVAFGFSMDAGGSAEMYRRGKGMLQDGYGGSEHRRVANALMVQANRRH